MAPLDPLPWSMDPQLFIHTQGRNIVQIWKCKKTNLSQPMKREDFDYVNVVEKDKHQELVYMYNWDENDYNRLVNYISTKHLLVNGQGLLIVEQHKFLKDGNIDEKESPIYIRSLHILPLKTFIKGFGERTVPFRMIQYLEDNKNGTTMAEKPLLGSSPEELKLEAELEKVKKDKEALERQVLESETEIETLENKIKKLTAGVATQTKKVTTLEQELNRVKSEMAKTIADLEGKKKTLEAKVTKSTTDLAKQTKLLETWQQELKQLNSDKKALDRKIIDLNAQINTPWMNGNTGSNWAGFDQLASLRNTGDYITVIGSRNTFGAEDSTTNVRANYFNKVKLSTLKTYSKAVIVRDLPDNGKARFDRASWFVFYNRGGTQFVCRRGETY